MERLDSVTDDIIQLDGSYDFPDSDSGGEEEEEVVNNVHDNNEINMDDELNENCARFFLTNARSITHKIDSLKDAFDYLNLHFECITETWYKGGKELADHVVEVEGASGIRILHKSRDGRTKKRGGGVAIAFNTAVCNLKQAAKTSRERL